MSSSYIKQFIRIRFSTSNPDLETLQINFVSPKLTKMKRNIKSYKSSFEIHKEKSEKRYYLRKLDIWKNMEHNERNYW